MGVRAGGRRALRSHSSASSPNQGSDGEQSIGRSPDGRVISPQMAGRRAPPAHSPPYPKSEHTRLGESFQRRDRVYSDFHTAPGQMWGLSLCNSKTAASMTGNRSGAASMVGPSRRRWPGAALRQRIPRPTPSRNTPASAKASGAGIAFIPISTPHPDGSASHPYQSVVARRRTHLGG